MHSRVLAQPLSNCSACRRASRSTAPRSTARYRSAAGARCIRTALPPGTAAEQRVAMQWAARVNEAYRALKDPLKRAAYLCDLHGVADRRRDEHGDAGRFLMQQLEWREALDDARLTIRRALQALAGEVDAERARSSSDDLAALLDVDARLRGAPRAGARADVPRAASPPTSTRRTRRDARAIET